MTVYTTSDWQLADLQAVIDEHPISAVSGRCVTCDVEGPCRPRYNALYVLAARRQLPRRQAGATRPELVGARRVRVS